MLLNENTFRNIVEISPFPVYVCSGEDMIITVANGATLKAWGRDRSVIGLPFRKALPELENQPFEQLIRKVYTTGETYYTERDRADLIIDGCLQTFYFKFTYQALRNEANNIESVLCFATDVTELEHARQQVEKSQQILSNIVRQAPVGICIINVPDLCVHMANDAYLELVGRTRAELENKAIWDSIPEAAESYEPVLNAVISTGTPFYAKEHELMLVRNGVEEDVFIDFVYEPIRDVDDNIGSILVIGIEVTDKVNARRSIEEAEERARLAVDAAEIGTYDLDLVTNQVRASQRFNAIFGYDRTVDREMFVSRFHPDDIKGRSIAHETAFKSGQLSYEARIIWEDKSVRWVRVQGKVYYKNGVPNRILGTVLDITEFKRLQQQKDDFISVASHELKTPLTTIKASMQLLDRLIKTDVHSKRIPEFIDKVSANLLKMQQLVESLLNVSKITSGQLELHKTIFNVSDMIENCCDHVRMGGDYNIELTGERGAEVFADRYKIDQVIVNFVNNAVKYAPECKNITVNISTENNMVKVAVTDYGKGIPSSKLPFLFDRYYRVDNSGIQYSGLGLGLYISSDIISRHNGKIGVESEEGVGSTFWFTLPIS